MIKRLTTTNSHYWLTFMNHFKTSFTIILAVYYIDLIVMKHSTHHLFTIINHYRTLSISINHYQLHSHWATEHRYAFFTNQPLSSITNHQYPSTTITNQPPTIYQPQPTTVIHDQPNISVHSAKLASALRLRRTTRMSCKGPSWRALLHHRKGKPNGED